MHQTKPKHRWSQGLVLPGLPRCASITVATPPHNRQRILGRNDFLRNESRTNNATTRPGKEPSMLDGDEAAVNIRPAAPGGSQHVDRLLHAGQQVPQAASVGAIVFSRNSFEQRPPMTGRDQQRRGGPSPITASNRAKDHPLPFATLRRACRPRPWPRTANLTLYMPGTLF